MAKSDLEAFLESDEETLIPSDATRIDLSAPSIANKSGISFQDQDHKKKLDIDLALVAPFATPNWDKPVEAKKSPTGDPTLDEILGESKIYNVDRSLSAMRLFVKDPVKEPKAPEAPLFVRSMEAKGMLSEPSNGFMTGLAGIKEDQKKVVQESATMSDQEIDIRAKSKASRVLEAAMNGSWSSTQDSKPVDPKLSASKTSNAYRGIFGQ